MSDKKINLLGYSLESLEAFFTDINEPKFRAKQLIKWIHQKGVLDFSQMTDFNKILREKLELIACLKTPMIEKVYKSPEGTIKYLVKLESGSMIEMVRIPEKKRMTLCISSQQAVLCSVHFALLVHKDLKQILLLMKLLANYGLQIFIIMMSHLLQCCIYGHGRAAVKF